MSEPSDDNFAKRFTKRAVELGLGGLRNAREVLLHQWPRFETRLLTSEKLHTELLARGKVAPSTPFIVDLEQLPHTHTHCGSSILMSLLTNGVLFSFKHQRALYAKEHLVVQGIDAYNLQSKYKLPWGVLLSGSMKLGEGFFQAQGFWHRLLYC